MSLPLSKDDIRDVMRKQRAALESVWVMVTSNRIADRVIGLPEFSRAASLCCYCALPGEVQTRRIMEAAWRAGKPVAMPALRDDGEYMPAWITPEEPMTHGRFGLLQPLAPHWAKPDRFDLMVVPGVAFSKTGARLGHGRGYYDRMLARLASRIECKAGLGFASQLVQDIPVSEHDVGMDVIVTEDAVYRIT